MNIHPKEVIKRIAQIEREIEPIHPKEVCSMTICTGLVAETKNY